MKKAAAVILTGAIVFLSACRVGGWEKAPTGETVLSSETDREKTAEQTDSSQETQKTEQSGETVETSSPESSSPETDGSSEAASETENAGGGRQYNSDSLTTDSDAYCVIDEDGRIVIGKNEFERREPASTTKVLTALIIAENCQPDSPVRVTEADVTEGIDIMSSGVYPSLKPGETLTVRDLLAALILPSTNAAGSVLADYAAGSNEAFADLMNARAASLGLTHSHFSNPHGLHGEDHYTCAYDMAVILKAAMENPLAAEILSMSSCMIPATEYSAERYEVMGHAMLNGSYDCPGVIGGKSGYTAYSGNTLVTAVERDGRRLYVCTLHSDEGLSYFDTENVIRYAYSCLKNEAPALIAIAHDARITGADGTGIDLSFSVDNPCKSARIVYWDMYQGTSTAQEILFGKPPEKVDYHLNLPYQGTFMIQFAATGYEGKESIIGTSILNSGAVYEKGLVRWNGQDYMINERGFLLNGAIETADGCYYTQQDGAVGHGFVGGRFYAGEDGKLMTGWIEVNGATYYLQADGRIATGTMMIGGEVHHFADNGAMID